MKHVRPVIAGLKDDENESPIGSRTPRSWIVKTAICKSRACLFNLLT